MTALVRDDTFDTELDSEHDVRIEGFFVRVSDALALNPLNYMEAQRRWRLRKNEETSASVITEYPHPIAVRFKKARQKLEWSQKLDRLQDTWEAMIIVVAGLCVCEARQKRLDCSGLGIQSRDIAFHVVNDAIEILKALAGRHGNVLTTIATLPADAHIFEWMEQLNAARRHLAHGATPSESEARSIFEKCEPITVSLAESFSTLSEISFVTPLDTQRGFRFTGASPDLEAAPLTLGDANRIVLFGRSGRPDRRDVYAVHEGGAFCLSPLFRWEETEDGHFRFLYLDEVKTRGLRYRSFSSIHIYDTSDLDDDRVRSLREDEAVLRQDFEELRALFRAGSSASEPIRGRRSRTPQGVSR